MKKIYVDNAATTPLDKEVLKAMLPYLKNQYANPSSMHLMGIDVKKQINQARQKVAELCGVSQKGVIFTSGGTEATNLAIRGYASKHPEKIEIITSVIEHHATLHTLDQLEKNGYIIHRLPVNHEGFIEIEAFKKVISEHTLLATFIWANNEIGTIQDIKVLGEICKKYQCLLHVDAVQMIAHEKIDLSVLPIDMMSISAHKFYGPKGTGALLMKDHVSINPILYGGNQEMGLRSGTENVYGIIGLTKALERMVEHVDERKQHAQMLCHSLKKRIQEVIPNVICHGPFDDSKRLPGLISLSFKGVSSQSLAFGLNDLGIYVSTGSACLSNEIKESHVLKAIHVDPSYGTLRLSFGKDNQIEEIDEIVKRIKKVYDELIS